MEFTRRLGKGPKKLGLSAALYQCPDLWELSDGSFAVIGVDRTAELRDRLPSGAHCGEGERIVVLPRAILTSAKEDIPAS